MALCVLGTFGRLVRLEHVGNDERRKKETSMECLVGCAEGGTVKDTKKPECDGDVHYLDCGGCVSLVYTYDKTHQITYFISCHTAYFMSITQ